ncbi:hypothetical protein BDV93DRAFT_557411 [Ceratobasidium sp. AG-I]|nr:hypothetical protein BDV93DRAFT_557411 [Ceratobasidium sp. AG-I]
MSYSHQRPPATRFAPPNPQLLQPIPEASHSDGSSMSNVSHFPVPFAYDCSSVWWPLQRTYGSSPTFVYPDSRPSSRSSVRSDGSLIGGINLGISSAGSTVFDYQTQNNTWIRPRRVVEMQCHSQQNGDMHEHIVLKLSDPTRHKDLWIRFKPYSDPDVGDIAYQEEAFLTPGMALRATLTFEDGIKYEDAVALRAKMSMMFQTPDTNTNRLTRACVFSEMLSLRVGRGMGLCSPQDLCEIWAPQSDSDRRLLGLQWCEKDDDSGVEYLVLHIVGTSDFTSMEDWWVRLERDGAIDQACISRDRDLVVYPGSKQTHLMTFQDGLPFEKVIEVLRSIPNGFSAATEDCWYYASTVAHHLSVAVGDDICECPTEDLCEIWSGDRGSQLHVNRVQWLEEDGGDQIQYMVINVSDTKDSKHGLWVRAEQSPILGGDIGFAYISQNRKHVVRQGSFLIADIIFNDLKFGVVNRILKQITKSNPTTVVVLGDHTPLPAMVIEQLTTATPVPSCYWVEGTPDRFIRPNSRARFPNLSTLSI